jgi:hypothetical protein
MTLHVELKDYYSYFLYVNVNEPIHNSTSNRCLFVCISLLSLVVGSSNSFILVSKEARQLRRVFFIGSTFFHHARVKLYVGLCRVSCLSIYEQE